MNKKFKLFFFLISIFTVFYLLNIFLLKKIQTISVIKIFDNSELMGQITKSSLLEICNDEILEFNCHVFRQRESRTPKFFTDPILTIDYSKSHALLVIEEKLIQYKTQYSFYEQKLNKINKSKYKKQDIKNLFIINFNKDLELENLKKFIKNFENAQEKNIKSYLKKNDFVRKKLKKIKSEEDIINYETLRLISQINITLIEEGNMNYRIDSYDNQVPSYLFILIITFFLSLISFCSFWFIKKNLSNFFS